MAEAARAALEEQRTKQKNELQHTINVLEFDQVRARLVACALGRPAKQQAATLEPALTRDEANQRQMATASAMRVIHAKGNFPLPIESPSPELIRQSRQGAVLGLSDLLQAGRFLTSVRRLRALVPEEEDSHEEGDNKRELIYDLLEELTPIPELERILTTAILSEDEVANDASPELARIRVQIKRRQESVREHLDVILRAHSNALQENLVTLRGDRYVVPVKAAFRSAIPGLVHDTSGSGQTLFIEPLAVVEANNAVTELRVEEREEIYRIRQVLSAEIGDHEFSIRSDVNRVAAIDLICACARLAIDMRATRPILNSDGRIHLKQARHPLIPANEVVPIDFHIGDEFKTLVVTGPNTGGKTVTLKTCGLLTLMAMSGLHVPAQEKSELAFFSQVLADIGDEQSIEQSLSTFSAHMRNIVRITQVVDPDSLVLMDELGSGTDPSEGAALAQAILNYLSRRGATCVATTHYKELKAYAIQTEGVENASCEFDVQTLKPTYRLLIGVPGVSHAFTISQKLGLGDDIIDSAQTFLSNESIQFEGLITSIEKDRLELEEERRAVRREQADLDAQLRRHRRREDELDTRERNLKQMMLQEARAELQDKSDAIDDLIRQIRKDVAESRMSGVTGDADALRELVNTDLNRIEGEIGKQTRASLRKRGQGDREAAPTTIEIGEKYYAPSLNIEGRVITRPDKNGMVQLESGVLKVNVPASELRMPRSQREKKQDSKSSSSRKMSGGPSNKRAGGAIRSAARQTFSHEIKVLGMTVDEASITVDRFLDQATLAGAERVRIVHGKGTGALRSAISDILRRDSRVSHHELAAFGEGDSGVTIATLK